MDMSEPSTLRRALSRKSKWALTCLAGVEPPTSSTFDYHAICEPITTAIAPFPDLISRISHDASPRNVCEPPRNKRVSKVLGFGWIWSHRRCVAQFCELDQT